MIWSCDTCQRTPCFYSCQLSNSKYVHCKPRLHASVFLLASAWLPCCATLSSLLGTCPQSMPLARLTMKQELHSFLFYACMWFCSYCYGALLGSPSSRWSSLKKKSMVNYNVIYVSVPQVRTNQYAWLILLIIYAILLFN